MRLKVERNPNAPSLRSKLLGLRVLFLKIHTNVRRFTCEGNFYRAGFNLSRCETFICQFLFYGLTLGLRTLISN